MEGYLLDWSDDESIGVADLDEEHKELFRLYNAVVNALVAGHELPTVRESIRNFVERARKHFAAEEQFMRDIRYPRYVSHKAEHDKLLMDAEDFLESIGSALLEADCPAVAKYLRFWMLRHLQDEDKEIADFLQSKVTA